MVSENSYLAQAEIDLTNRIKKSGVRFSSKYDNYFVPKAERDDPYVANNYECSAWFESVLYCENFAEVFWSKPSISRFLGYYNNFVVKNRAIGQEYLPIYFFLSNKMVNCVLGKVDFKYLWATHRLGDPWFGELYLNDITKLHGHLATQYDAIKDILKDNFEQLLIVMSEDQDPLVRRAAAMAPGSPQSVIKKLLLDSDSRVIDMAKNHEHGKDLVIFV